MKSLKGDAREKFIMKSEEMAYQDAKREMTKITDYSAITDNEQSIDRVAPLRFLLDPMGVKTNMLSISVDPESYTFGDFFNNVNRFVLFREMEDEGDTCDELARKSLAAYSDNLNKGNGPRTSSAKASCRPYRSDVLEPAWLKDNDNITDALYAKRRKELKPKVKDALLVCTMCHETSRNFAGAPVIPFGDPDKLEGLLSKKVGEIGNFQDTLWKRLRMHSSIKGAMPLGFPDAALTDAELADVKEYLESFPKRDYIDRIDTGIDTDTLTSGGIKALPLSKPVLKPKPKYNKN